MTSDQISGNNFPNKWVNADQLQRRLNGVIPLRFTLPHFNATKVGWLPQTLTVRF